MPKTVVEMDDILDDLVDTLKGVLQDEFEEFKTSNPGLNPKDWEPHDFLTERADGLVPVYTKQQNDLYYLYGTEFEEAYRNAGIGDGREDNHQAVTIFCYLEEKGWDEVRRLKNETEEE